MFEDKERMKELLEEMGLERKVEEAVKKIGKGSRVRIKRDSPYAKQNDGPGTVQENFGDCESKVRGEPCVRVVFDDGYKNDYRERDLELIGLMNQKPELERILVVESENNFRKYAIEYFKEIGFEVDFVEDNYEAMEKIQKTKYKCAILAGQDAEKLAKKCLELNLPSLFLNGYHLYGYNSGFEKLDSFNYKKGRNAKVWESTYTHLKKIMREKEQKNA